MGPKNFRPGLLGRIQIDLLFAMMIDGIHLGPCRKVTGISDQTRSSDRNSYKPDRLFSFSTDVGIHREYIIIFSILSSYCIYFEIITEKEYIFLFSLINYASSKSK